MRSILALAASLTLAAPVKAQTLEQVQDELEAQKQINEILKQRIENLEGQLAGRAAPPPPRAAAPLAVQDDPEQELALERALQRRGAAVLAPNVVEIAPSLSWSHSGRDALASTDDRIGAAMDARMGLPAGWMIGARIPVTYRRLSGVGTSGGLGDVSVALWKSLSSERGSRPSLVGSLRYIAPTGAEFTDDDVPLGSGFHRINARLVALKSFDPIAFYGDLNYTAPIAEEISGFDVERQAVLGAGAGANLAVTPEISVSAGFDFAFEGEAEIDGVEVGEDTTLGLFEFGVGILLSRNAFLALNGAFGVTDDSPDVTVGASLPIRF